MSQFWLAFVLPAAASGRLKEVYEQVKSPNGQVDRVYQVQSLRRIDIDHMRNQGATDEEILEVNQVTASFNYSNRVISGLGVEPGEEQVGYYGTE